MTLEAASALPEIIGDIDMPGEPGVVVSAVGFAGGVESSVYVVDTVEHNDVLFVPSVAFA